MSTDVRVHRNAQVMRAVGIIGLLAAIGWLVLADQPFPMWLILAGAALMFLGVGAALDRQARSAPR